MQPTIEDTLPINITSMREIDLFNRIPGSHFTLTWDNGSSIGGVFTGQSLRFMYRSTMPHCEQIERDESVSITSTPCRYGGQRYWLHCPRCDKRSHKLRLGRQGILCRECYRLPYYTQLCSDLDALGRKKRKLEGKLFNSGPRRGKTVKRLAVELERVEAEYNRVFWAMSQSQFGHILTD